MRIAYLDCFSGISGDMFLGALIDAGVSPKLMEDAVAALNIGARLEISRVQRGGISATKVDVYVNGEKDLPREVYLEQGKHTHSHSHDHHARDEHSHAHSHDHHLHDEVHGPTHGRGLTEIRAIIQKSAINAAAKTTAIKIFEALGVAEAEIHGTSID